jgi:hypothetical protein
VLPQNLIADRKTGCRQLQNWETVYIETKEGLTVSTKFRIIIGQMDKTIGKQCDGVWFLLLRQHSGFRDCT